MVKSLVAITLLVITFVSSNIKAEDSIPVAEHTARRYARIVEEDILSGRLAERTNFALDAIIQTAVTQLRLNGMKDEAEKLKKEWEENWFGFVLRVRDLGDHKPLSLWLASVYARLENLLGPELMGWLNLDHIKIINYALPVVFRPCQDEWDREEYKKHFVPLAGVLAYWGAIVPCWVLSSGIGAFFCAPLGMLSEHIMKRFIAPGISDRAYIAACGERVKALAP